MKGEIVKKERKKQWLYFPNLAETSPKIISDDISGNEYKLW